MTIDVQSSGVLVFRQEPAISFLLMRHPQRWDLPKGHLDPGETVLEAAIRELEEETSISPAALQLDDRFRFDLQYEVPDRRQPDRQRRKQLTIFLGWLTQDCDIVVTEHDGYHWQPWAPPHRIQTQTIDPVLAAVEEHFQVHSLLPPE